MKRNIVTWSIIGGVAALIIIFGGLYLAARQSADKQNNDEMQRRASLQPKLTKASADKPTNTQPGAYANYDASTVAKSSGTKVLFFHAPWCPQCRMLDSDIKRTKLPDNLTIFKVDYDSNQSLRQEYGVTLQTTFVMIDDSGKLQKKYVAYNEPNYAALKEHLLD